MNENDQRVRKQWLILWILSLSISAINILLQQLFDPLLDQLHLARYCIGAISVLTLCAFGFTAYHCIYKKPGTKLLTFCLVLTVTSLASTPILYLSGKIHAPSYIPYYGAYLLATQAIGIGWAVACWRMRKTNKRLQALEKIEPSAPASHGELGRG